MKYLAVLTLLVVVGFAYADDVAGCKEALMDSKLYKDLVQVLSCEMSSENHLSGGATRTATFRATFRNPKGSSDICKDLVMKKKFGTSFGSLLGSASSWKIKKQTEC